MGPYLPVSTMAGALVEDPRGGVIIVGGYLNIGLNTLYRLKHGGLNAQWTLLQQTLAATNYFNIAIMLPDDLITNCTL